MGHHLTAAVAAALLAAAPRAALRADVIRDNRLSDVGLTPAVGRGYSPGANLLHGVCFETAPTTTASFDFDFTFTRLERTATGQLVTSSADAAAFVRDHARTSTVVREQVTHHVHYLLATLAVDSYYASIDESRARLSDSALGLLRGGDLLAFFSGCGTHYLRSLSRRSSFLTLFAYTSTSARRDEAFERTLEHAVRAVDLDGVLSDADLADRARLETEARQRELTVVSRSVGLVAQATASLIPFDLASFRGALRDAFLAAQDEHVGRVVASEVTAWLDNPVVLAVVDLDGDGPEDAAGRFLRKRIVADNAAFYVELTARVRAVEAAVDRARLCRARLDDLRDGSGALPAAAVINHRGGAPLPVARLADALSDDVLARRAAAEQAFLHGADGEGGAAACVAALEQRGLAAASYTALPACAALVTPSLPHEDLLDEHCLPQLASP